MGVFFLPPPPPPFFFLFLLLLIIVDASDKMLQSEDASVWSGFSTDLDDVD